MDIYILREGKEIGPFNEAKTQMLLTQGSVADDDLCWYAGMEKWLPLAEVIAALDAARQLGALDTATTEIEPSHELDPETIFEPPTRKQRALLAYLGIAVEDQVSRALASTIICDAMEDVTYSAHFDRWQTERLLRHPDLFAAEIQAKRDRRAHHFHRLTQTEGAEYFSNFSLSHAETLVSHLDLSLPGWDAKEATAACNYFFPAIAEKFPHLANAQWQNRLHYPSGPKNVAPTNALPNVRRPPAARSGGLPIMAMARGVVIGLLILGGAWFARTKITGAHAKSPAAATPADTSETATAPAPIAEPEPASTTPAETAEAMKPAETSPAPTAEMTAQSEPALPVGASVPAPPTARSGPPPPMTPIRLTKSVEAKLAFGKAVLPPGTTVKFLSQEGAWLRVQYIKDTIIVPASATNVSELASAPSAAPGLMRPPSSPATDPLAPPPAAKESLFGDLPTTPLPAPKPGL